MMTRLSGPAARAGRGSTSMPRTARSGCGRVWRSISRWRRDQPAGRRGEEAPALHPGARDRPLPGGRRADPGRGRRHRRGAGLGLSQLDRRHHVADRHRRRGPVRHRMRRPGAALRRPLPRLRPGCATARRARPRSTPEARRCAAPSSTPSTSSSATPSAASCRTRSAHTARAGASRAMSTARSTARRASWGCSAPGRTRLTAAPASPTTAMPRSSARKTSATATPGSTSTCIPASSRPISPASGPTIRRRAGCRAASLARRSLRWR